MTSTGPEAGQSVRADDALAAEDVTVAFSGVKALDGVTFLCRPGEIVGLIGPNGSGKTTLLNALSGFLEPESAFRSVVFPEPFGPIKPTISPGLQRNVTPSSAFTPLNATVTSSAARARGLGA